MTIARIALDDVLAHAGQSRPGECCGVLIGRADHIVSSVRARNLSDSLVRFVIDPKDHIDARRRARAEGQEVVGFYHSHPHSRPVPSTTDLAEAAYLDSVHLIVSGLEEEPRARLFRIEQGRAEELAMTVVDEGPR